jgi:hypothetical protein
VVDVELAVELELERGVTGTVVGVLKITSVMPEITVVNPFSENSEFTGTVAGPVKTTSVVPPITVT